MHHIAHVGDDKSLILKLIELVMVIFASATFAYHICIIFEWPAWVVIIPFSCLLGSYLYLSFYRLFGGISISRADIGYLFLIVGCGAILGMAMLVISRPDADDVQFFYRVLVQLQDLNRPFILTTEIHDVKQLPMSSIGLVPFYEHSVGLVANLLHIDPLTAYQNISIFFACIGFLLTYTLIYRQLGLKKNAALVATLMAIIFLLFDGNTHHSFGSVSLLRMWQGKVILWSLVVPLSMICTYRHIEKPSLISYFMVFLCSIVGLGLSATGLFLVPAMVLVTSLASFIGSGVSLRVFKSVLVINTTSAYSLFLLVCIVLDVFPAYPIKDVFDGWGATWYENLKLVIPNVSTLVRNLIILLVVPLYVLPSPHNRLLPLVTIVVCFLYLNPVTGPIIFDLITAGSYWRLVYLLPLPLAAGLLGPLLMSLFANSSKRLLAIILLIISSASILVAYQNNILFPSGKLAKVWFKKPLSYRFRPEEQAISEIVSHNVRDGEHLLAPQTIVHIVPLLNPNISLETARSFNTFFVFSNAGRPEEGRRRVIAQKLVTDCIRSTQADQAFRLSVANGITAIVVKKCESRLLDKLKDLIDDTGKWHKVTEEAGYIFYIKV